MARLFVSGFELNTTTDGVEWTTNGTTGTTIDSTIKRSGGYSMKIDLTSGARSGATYQYSSAADAGPNYFRAYYYFSTLPSGETILMSLKSGGSGLNAADRIWVTVDNSGTVKLYDEDGLIATHGNTVTTSTWYRFELGIDLTGAAGADIVYFRLDGSQIGATNRDISVNPMTFAVGGNITQEAVTGTWYIDDVAINDSTGSYQTSWPGEGRLGLATPNAAGDNAMGARGGTDSGTDYGQVSSYNDASYYVLDVDNDIVDFNCTSASTAGIGSTDSITLVAVGYRVRDSATSGASASKARLKSTTSGTLAEGTALGDLGTTFNTNNTAAPKNYRLVSYVDPQDSLSWTSSDIDSMQIGYQATDAAPDVWISLLYAYIEYRVNPTVTLSSPSDTGTVSSTTPDLTFYDSAGDSDNVRYNVQVATAAFSNPSIRSSSKNDASTGTAVSVSAPTGTAAGDFMVVIVHVNTQTTIVDNNGSTAFTEDINDYQPNTVNGHTMSIFSRTIQSGDPSTYNFTSGATGRWGIIAICFSEGHEYEVSPNTSNFANEDSSTDGNITAPSIYQSGPETIHIAFCGWDTGSASTITPPTGYTLIQDAKDNSGQVTHASYKLYTSPSDTGSLTFNNTAFAPKIAGSFTVKRKYLIDKVSGTDAGFSGSPDNSDPFASGQSVTYTVQSALTNGNTYYWRVRGKDPNNANIYGAMPTSRSFTVSVGGGGSVVKDIIMSGFIPFAR